MDAICLAEGCGGTRPERQRQKIPERVQPTSMANTFNEGISLKEAFLPLRRGEISAIRISRLVTNFELFTEESSVRNNHAGGGEEVGGGQQSSTCQRDRRKTRSRCHV